MRNLIITKRGTVISEQATDMKTDIGTINAQLNTALNADEKLVVNLIKKYTSDKSTFQNFLNQYKWCAAKCGTKFYAKGIINKKSVYLNFNFVAKSFKNVLALYSRIYRQSN